MAVTKDPFLRWFGTPESMCGPACPGLEPCSSELVLWRLTQQCRPQAAYLFYNRGRLSCLESKGTPKSTLLRGWTRPAGESCLQNHWVQERVQSTGHATHPPRGLACCSIKKSQPFGSLNIASPNPLSSVPGGCMALAQTQLLLSAKPKPQRWARGRAVARIFCTIS